MRIGVGSRERKIGKRENVSRETFSLCTCVGYWWMECIIITELVCKC